MKKLPIALFLTFLMLNAGCKKEELNNPGSLLSETETGAAAPASQRASTTINDISFVVTAVEDAEYFELSELNDGSRIIKIGACSGTISGKINASLSKFWILDLEPVENPDFDNPDNLRGLPYYYLVDGEGIIYTRPTDYFRFTMTDGAYLPGNYEAGLFGPDPLMGAVFSTFILNVLRPGSVQITEGYGKFKSLTGKKLKAQNGFDPYQINRTTGTWKFFFSPFN